jgi:hypothetical protein
MFLNQATLTDLDADWHLWAVELSLRYQPTVGGTITVPVDFVTDGPSIPRIFWAILPVWGRYGRAGIVHDYLCYLLDKGAPHKAAQSRTQADGIFYEAMTALGVGWLPKWILYIGVRIGTLLGVKTTMIQHQFNGG